MYVKQEDTRSDPFACAAHGAAQPDGHFSSPTKWLWLSWINAISRGGAISLIYPSAQTRNRLECVVYTVETGLFVFDRQATSDSATLMSLVLSENEIKHEVLVGIRRI